MGVFTIKILLLILICNRDLRSWEIVLMFEQILPSSTIRNLWSVVRRIKFECWQRGSRDLCASTILWQGDLTAVKLLAYHQTGTHYTTRISSSRKYWLCIIYLQTFGEPFKKQTAMEVPLVMPGAAAALQSFNQPLGLQFTSLIPTSK